MLRRSVALTDLAHCDPSHAVPKAGDVGHCNTRSDWWERMTLRRRPSKKKRVAEPGNRTIPRHAALRLLNDAARLKQKRSVIGSRKMADCFSSGKETEMDLFFFLSRTHITINTEHHSMLFSPSPSPSQRRSRFQVGAPTP